MVYEFEHEEGVRAWARAYADDFGTVTLFGPFRGDSLDTVAAPVFTEAVLTYLTDRFARVADVSGPIR